MQKCGRERSGEENRAKAVATKKRKTISQLSERERRAECDGSCSNDTTAGVLPPPSSSRHQPAFKEPLDKYVCARLWRRSWPPETVWIHLDPVLQKLRTGHTEGQHLHIFGDAAAPSATTPGDLRDHRKHLPGEGGLQPGNNRPCPPISICWPFTQPHRQFESCLLGLFRPYFVSLTKVPKWSCDQNREWWLPSKG